MRFGKWKGLGIDDCARLWQRLRKKSELNGIYNPKGRITSILNGKRAITPETALRLGRFFGNSAQFWLNLQARYDLLVVERELGRRIKAEVKQAA